MAGSQISPPDISFTRLTDFYLAEVRKGTAPSVDAFAEAFPHHSKEILETFPTLALLEKAIGKRHSEPAPCNLTSLGGCKIQEEIGRGAMGIVYRAYQQELDRTVAIKVISRGLASAAGLIERFELERHAMARVDHPNVVPVYNYGHNERYAFLVMKYIDGRSLEKLIQPDADYRSKALLTELQGDWRFFATMASNIAAGLQHTHELGLVHRDIKPANLLLDLNRKVWITDFGLAKVYDFARSVSRTGDAIGTPRYMAPEQLRGVCDPRSDIYSLGITLYELAGGCKVWKEHTFQTLTSDRGSIELVDVRKENPEVPEGLAKIIMKACEFSPENRYQTCQELQVVLERFAAGLPEGDRRKKNRDRDEVYRRKRRWMNGIILASGLTTFAGGLIVIPLLKSESKPPPSLADQRRNTTANFVERLADADSGDLPKVLTDFVRDSINDSSADFRLAPQEKKEIENQFDKVISELKGQHQRGTTPEMGGFIENYRQSAIPTATKLMSYGRLIERSKLTPQEQQSAFETLRVLAKLVINRKVSIADAQRLMDEISQGKSLSVSELERLKVNDQALRKWLANIRTFVKQIPAANAAEELKMAKEVQLAIEAIKKMPQPAYNPRAPIPVSPQPRK